MKRANRLRELQLRFEDLERIGENPGGAVARDRGHKFEDLLLDLFRVYKILIRPAFHTSDNKSEQIDGAISLQGRIALVEAKWTKESLAASELYSFLGKVEGKFSGTIGVFISRTELSQNFISALRSGRRQRIIVIHGDDVPFLFSPEFELIAYLRECLHHLSIDNKPHLSAADFLKQREQRQEGLTLSRREQYKVLLDRLRRPNAADLIALLLNDKDPETLESELRFLIKVLPKILLSDLAVSPLKQNTINYIVEGLDKLPRTKTALAEDLARDVIPNVLALPDYSPIVGAFANRANRLGEASEHVTDSLVESWREASGTFLDENRLVDATKALWVCLDQDGKEAILAFFIDILNSYNHRPGFPQFELAREKVNSETNMHLVSKIIEEQVASEFNKLIKGELASDVEDLHGWAWKVVVGSFSKARGRIEKFDQIIDKARQDLLGHAADSLQAD
jgi:hypothetical protein